MIENRKEDHIRIAEGKEVNASHNYWDDITLIHRAIPEVNYDGIDTKVDFHGNRIDYPILISSMTGGTDLARKINENLAWAAEKFHIPMGLGSMRAAAEKKDLAGTYSVINNYSIPFKLANIGAPQLIRQILYNGVTNIIIGCFYCIWRVKKEALVSTQYRGVLHG